MSKDKIKRFIECIVPVTACNLRCHYCYVIQNDYRTNKIPKFEYSPEYIAKALSKKRLVELVYSIFAVQVKHCCQKKL